MEIERFVSKGTTPPVFEAVRGIPESAVEPLPEGVTCLVAREGGRPAARLGLYAREDLVGAPGGSGLIGHYEALNRDAGVALLGAACRELADQGVARVLGPMNGSTWMRYRLALPSQPGDPACEPPFFAGEPRNSFDYPEHFEAAGFRVVARYESRIDDLAGDALDAGEVTARATEGGFSLRALDVAHFDAELAMLYSLSHESFAENLFYSPIDEAAFRALYQPLRSLMDPQFVLIALDRAERPCGYLFAFADPLSVRDGQPVRLIAKTVAVSPRARGHGVANHMLDRIRSSSRSRGYSEVIHALMHVSNLSTRMSARFGSEVFRRYALWEWAP
jgi:GNAT superfamily N-acetyltransferase